jgi:hypothetical protein
LDVVRVTVSTNGMVLCRVAWTQTTRWELVPGGPEGKRAGTVKTSAQSVLELTQTAVDAY